MNIRGISFGIGSGFLCALYTLCAAGTVEDLDAWLKLPRASRPALETQAFAGSSLSKADADRARDLVWSERLAYVKSSGAAEWSAKKLVDAAGLQMPFDYKIYGTKPAAGYDLYLSMHGGGEAPKALNDEQWQNQIGLYQPKGIYLAPRAPTDTWNMWFKDHIDGFFDRLIQLCVANLGANPDRVYVMGYSAGGDGTYQLAPRMADRWAAAAMMAGHPNDASPINLRGIGFTMHVGALDAAFDRNTICVTYGKAIQKLQDADPGFYKYDVQVHAGKPHWMDLEDKVALDWTFGFTRKPLPAKVVWLQDGPESANSKPTQFQFHWLALPEKKAMPVPARLTAAIQGQEVAISEANVDSLVVLLNDTLLDLDRSVRVTWKGKAVFDGPVPRNAGNLYRTANDRGDRAYVFPASLLVKASGQVSLAPRAAAAGGRRRQWSGHSSWSTIPPGKAGRIDASGKSLPD
ncbi:MAG: alpha/beta hydrolase [Fibrobacteria bacterium]